MAARARLGAADGKAEFVVEMRHSRRRCAKRFRLPSATLTEPGDRAHERQPDDSVEVFVLASRRKVSPLRAFREP
jgi:hypothetical protein